MSNRLAQETSAYLLQHASNPVDWYPWGEEAFAEAKRRNVPVLLSIGYSTCHWCHVMESESFENQDIAKTMNDNYVSIKVDREERPDIDGIYMKVVQAMTGSGGWPMTVWLTPDKKPFFAGTYFPPFDGVRGAHVGFQRLLVIMKERFDKESERVAYTADEIVKYLQEQVQSSPAKDLPSERVLDFAFEVFKTEFDSENGGTAGAPKFPSSLPVLFLLHYSQVRKNPEALAMAEKSLQKMALRGLYDHVDGGFHRYCVDAEWTIPHFEKMLYDNGLLAQAYLECYLVTKNEFYRETLVDILSYLENEMRSLDGVFFAATDADSLDSQNQKEEGAFFVWSLEELQKIFSTDDFKTLSEMFDLESSNFEGRFHLVRRSTQVSSQWPQIRSVLKKIRDQRPKPLRDEKILVAWNALVISVFARAGTLLDIPKYVDLASQATDFLIKNLYKDGKLARSFQGRAPRGQGTLEDYAYLSNSLLDVFGATGNPLYFEIACALSETLEKHFRDPQGGYFHSSDEARDIILRDKPIYDGAEPSGNSVHFQNLLRLYDLTTDEKYMQRAESTLRILTSRLERAPHALGYLLSPLINYFSAPQDFVSVSEKRGEFLPAIQSKYSLGDSIYWVREADLSRLNQAGALLFLGKKDAKLFVCSRGICKV